MPCPRDSARLLAPSRRMHFAAGWRVVIDLPMRLHECRKAADFTTDDMILERVKGKQLVGA